MIEIESEIDQQLMLAEKIAREEVFFGSYQLMSINETFFLKHISGF